MSIIDELKSIGEVLRKADKIPEFNIILDIQQKLIDLQEENAELRSQAKALREKDKFECNLIYEKNAFYLVKKDGTKEGPYCPKCWGDESKKLRMYNAGHVYYCPKCKTYADL